MPILCRLPAISSGYTKLEYASIQKSLRTCAQCYTLFRRSLKTHVTLASAHAPPNVRRTSSAPISVFKNDVEYYIDAEELRYLINAHHLADLLGGNTYLK